MKFITPKISMALTLSFSLLACDIAAAAETVIGSWNILRFGHGDKKNMEAVTTVAARFDLLAIQELMRPEVLSDLEKALETFTRESWSSMASDSIGRGSYKESYGFIWRDSAVHWIDGAVVYTDSSDVFEREPFSARFESHDGFRFVLGTAHLIYGKTVKGREQEAQALAEYRDWLVSISEGSPVFISGDFNLPPTNAAWNYLGQNAHPLITEGATTLSSHNGRFANLYDNIWAPSGIPLPIFDTGILDFPRLLGIDHVTACETISDHAPVYMVLDSDAATVTMPPWSAAVAAVRSPAPPIAQPRATVSASSSGRPEEQSYSVRIHGNKNSKIWHHSGCPSYSKISAKNLVVFATQHAASAAGYRKAGNCP